MLRRNIIAGLLLAVLALPAAAGTWSGRTVAGMSVRLYVPTTPGAYPAGRGLMIGLHGCTQQATQLEQRGNWEAAADRFGVVIALPQVPNGGVIAGCWDYYGANHTRASRHDGPVLQLAAALIADAALGIDDAQVYVSGLSSGGGQAMVLGCLAPDVFAGVGINAGPTVGTASSEISRVATTAAAARQACERLAGAQSAAFDTQLASIVYGSMDHVVHQGYGALNAEVLAEIYGASRESAIEVGRLPGFMPRGTGRRFSDGAGARVEEIEVEGMGHAFPAGSGDGFEMSFIASRGVSWPMVMIEQFTVGNRRAQGGVVVPGADGGTTAARDAGSGAGRDGGARADASGAIDGGLAASDADLAGGVESGGCSSIDPASSAALLLLALARRRSRLSRPAC